MCLHDRSACTAPLRPPPSHLPCHTFDINATPSPSQPTFHQPRCLAVCRQRLVSEPGQLSKLSISVRQLLVIIVSFNRLLNSNQVC